MKALLIALITVILCPNFYAQTEDENIRLAILKSNVTDKNFVFGEWDGKQETETHLNYLGDIITKDNESYKIMTSCWIWGRTKKATNLILVYNEQNKLLGNYYLNTKCQLPNKIEKNKLVFKPAECTNCDTAITRVDFFDGIPKNLYLGCKRGRGNIFSFFASL